ncbi:MAG: AAA family ATPase [Clostridia bacterium]|nr:AAA family ATPase [Clostridia bacterium]
MKKSTLLNFLCDYAKSISESFGKSAITADHFMIAVLKTMCDDRDGKLPADIRTPEVSFEFLKINTLLHHYDITFDDVIEKISDELRSEEYNSSMDEFVFRKIKYTAEAEAIIKTREEVDTVAYLELIIKEPTDAISKHIISATCVAETPAAEVKKPEEPTPEPEPTPVDFSTLFDFDFSSDSDKKEEPADDLSATEQLCKTVETTKKIQEFLLDRVFGQDQAVNAFVSGYFQSEIQRAMRKDTRKPAAMFLFAGPPGVGKTFLAETAAEALKLPFRRFDMSEYSENESNIEFCGSDKVYKNGKAGNVTSFVEENPRCVLLFDEIEKSHINVIHLFLQMLDAGRLRDNYTDTEVSFTDAIIIFTTNVGRSLYEDTEISNLSAISRKKVIKAIAEDKNPSTGEKLFPAAICSRLASGHVVMFNRLGAGNLYTIVNRELQKSAKGFEDAMGIKINVDEKVSTALIFSEGGNADARTVKGKTGTFFHEELYEFFRLFASEKHGGDVEKLKSINVKVEFDEKDVEVSKLFVNNGEREILVFADADMRRECERKLRDVRCYFADTIAEAKELLFQHDVSAILCDVSCGAKTNIEGLLNAEDVQSVGRDFISYVIERYPLPIYILEENTGDISKEERLSFMKLGAKDIVTINSKHSASFENRVKFICDVSYQQGNMIKLAKANKVLTYKTAQTVSADQKTADIKLFDLRLEMATDTSDSGSVLDNISKPNVLFEDVIGAEDAKGELKYFVEYLKNPADFMRRGVRSPKGVLLYGPPGTGKTLLAKAMAGESDVTFLTAEGNQFLKSLIGQGADEVHKLFNAARKYAPSILFIDEIDAIGKDRSSAQVDNTGDVLTAFLTEMDGFKSDTSKPVFVLAATNYEVEPGRGKSLDPALLRRFDRRIYVDLPNKEERKRYLKMKISKNGNVALSDEQIDNIALRSTGMSLAELENVFEMALRNAIRSGGTVNDESFEEAFETFNSGEKKEWAPETLLRTARHEAGHALLSWIYGDKPSYLTIVARGNHGGYMQHGESEDKAIYMKSELLSKIRTALGGRAAELVYYGEDDGVSTGASGDLYTATKTCERMICSYGMDDEFGLSYIDENYTATDLAKDIRARINSVLEAELANAREVILSQSEAMDNIVRVLMDKNHLKGDEIDEIFRKYVKRK